MNLDQYQAWANQGMLKQGEALEIIALVRRQESELAAERDTNNRLTAALEQSKISYGALAMELAAAKAVQAELVKACNGSIDIFKQLKSYGHDVSIELAECEQAISSAKEQA